MFGEDFLRFLDPTADRLVTLTGLLAERGLAGTVLSIAGRRHVLLKGGASRPRVLFVAHYDRVAGSQGALDNSAACLVLARVASRLRELAGRPQPADRSKPAVYGQLADKGDAANPFDGVMFLFTDGEEAPASEGPLSQGAFALGHGLRAVLGRAIPAILVLDVVGRGSRLLVSSAPREMLARTGGADSATASLRALEGGVARAAKAAGLAAPLTLTLPWSDDLGFTMAGLPAVELSLLSEGEAESYRQGLAKRGPGGDGGEFHPTAERLGRHWPPTWRYLHGPSDRAELLEAASLGMMEAFCLDFCREWRKSV